MKWLTEVKLLLLAWIAALVAMAFCVYLLLLLLAAAWQWTATT